MSNLFLDYQEEENQDLLHLPSLNGSYLAFYVVSCTTSQSINKYIRNLKSQQSSNEQKTHQSILKSLGQQQHYNILQFATDRSQKLTLNRVALRISNTRFFVFYAQLQRRPQLEASQQSPYHHYLHTCFINEPLEFL